jgi:hypothetical protein
MNDARQIQRTIRCHAVTLAVVATGCSGAPSQTREQTSEIESPIINGSSVPSGTATAHGDVAITHRISGGPELCSGTLVRNDLVLTA